MSTPVGAVSAISTVRAAQRVRLVARVLEVVVSAIVVLSVLAIGSVHPWAYVPLWVACLVCGLLLATRALVVSLLRRRLGRRVFSLHPSGRWLSFDARPELRGSGVTFDLARPILPRAALLAPGAAFIGLVLLQLVPLPGALVGLLQHGADPAGASGWRPLTVAPSDTVRGLCFVFALFCLHLGAAATFEQREARERFRRLVLLLVLALGLLALLQAVTGTRRVYGVFAPDEGTGEGIFGPFVNRNHFAGYMLLALPVSLSLLARGWERYARRAGSVANLRRHLLALSSSEGTRLFYLALPALVGLAALAATLSRGGLAAFAAALVVAAVGARGRRGVPAWVFLAVVATAVTLWYGFERLESRFARSGRDAPARTLVWRYALSRMQGHWLTGTGFNTFGSAMSRVAAWKLPTGATPWPATGEKGFASGERVGYRVPAGIPGFTWYREAHNDYLQLLTETGVPGLLLALWGIGAALAAVRHDPWLVAGLAGVLVHEWVDFDLQIPAIAVLFVVLAAQHWRLQALPTRVVLEPSVAAVGS